MPIDTSIYNNLQPVRIDSPLNTLAKVSQVQALQNQNRLADLAYSQKQQQISDANALNDAYRGAIGPDGSIDKPKFYSALVSSGQGAQLPGIQKTFTEADTAALAQKKAQLDFALKKQGIVAQYAGAAHDQASWENGIRQLAAMGIDVSKVPTQYDPKTAEDLRNQALTGVQQLEQHNKAIDQQLNLAKFGYQQQNDAANRAVTLRGQNMTDSRAREQLGQGKIPAGYRQTADGNLQAIPGGPADLKLQGSLNQDTAALNGGISSMDRLATAANEALNHPGLAGTTGLRGMIPNIPGTEAADAEALLNTLKSQVAFGVLQDMRNNSKTGGALGAVSDAEGKRLESNLAALEKSQSLDQLKANLKKIVDYSNSAKDRLRQAYNMKHGAQSSKQSTTPSGSGAKPSLDDIFGK